MPKIYIIQEIIRETQKQITLTQYDIDVLKAELYQKTNRELENILEEIQEENTNTGTTE